MVLINKIVYLCKVSQYQQIDKKMEGDSVWRIPFH